MLSLFSSLFFLAVAASVPLQEESAAAAAAIGGEGGEGVLSWLRGKGGSAAEGLEVAEFPGMGRGFLATRDIEEGETILEVPNSVIFSVKNALRSQDLVHRRIAKAISKDQEQVVAALLLLERARGGASAWAPYIQLLPEYVPNGASEGFLVSELHNPQLELDVNRSIATLEAKYAVFRQALVAVWPDDLPLPGLPDLRWAASIVDSRALRFHGQINLIPVADVFNYQKHPVARKKNAGDFFLSHHRLSEDRDGGLTVTSDRPCSAGQQLFEDYGDNEDNIYLQYHGFVAHDNPFRCVDIQVSFSSDASETDMSESRRSLMAALRLNTTMKKCVDASGEVGLGILVYLAVQGFSEAEVEKCLTVVNKNKNDWNTIFVQCNFIQVQAEVGKYLDAVVPKVNRHFSEPHVSSGSRVEIPSALEQVDASGPSAYVLEQLRRRIDAAVNRLPTTLAEDRILLLSLNDQLNLLGSSVPLGERQALMRKALSLQYRVATKTHWRRFCCVYNAACCNVDESNDGSEALILNDHLSSAAIDHAKSELDEKLASFMEWFHAAGPATCKLRSVAIPGFRIGTVATDAISAKDEYLSVPVNVIMDAAKAAGPNSGVAPLIKALAAKFPNSKDAFHELLFFLMHEYFVLGERSFFWPYLSLLPTPAEMPIPVMWEKDEDVSARLGPSRVAGAVSSYRTNIRRLFDSISKIDLVSTFFEKASDREVFNFENYRWATAILDSRSIWWGGERHLVPLLDFVNCAQGPSAHVVHSTALDDSQKYAVTRAGWDFAPGEQVFEHYGQPNHIYFMYHGFVLPLNEFDCVQIEIAPTAEEAREVGGALTRTPSLKEVLQRLRVRDLRAGMSVCLKPTATLPDALWVFLSVLSGEAEAALSGAADGKSGMSALGNPSAATASRLLEIVEGKIREYEAFFASSGISYPAAAADVGQGVEGNWQAFLQTEVLALRGVRSLAAAVRDELMTGVETGEL